MTEPKPKKLCPKGHTVGSSVGGGRCGVTRCGADTAALLGPAKLDEDALAKVAPEDREHFTRMAQAGVPKGLKGEAATDWAKGKLVDLLPEAVASLQYDLRYGSDKVRSEAADKVLRANGLDKREASQGGGGLIILNLGTTGSNIPWLQRLSKKDES